MGIAQLIAHDVAGRVPLARLVSLYQQLPKGMRTTVVRAAGSAVVVVTPDPAETPPACWSALTARQCMVAREIGRGLSNKAIAARLGIAEGTVKDHVHHILQKTSLASRVEIALLAQSSVPTISTPRFRRHPSKDGCR